MQSRASKITKAHLIAAAGNMVLPAGISQDETDTVMPIPLKKDGKTEAKDKRRFEPVSVFYKK